MNFVAKVLSIPYITMDFRKRGQTWMECCIPNL